MDMEAYKYESQFIPNKPVISSNPWEAKMPTDDRIVLLGHRKQVGKDTFANYILEEINSNPDKYRNVAWAEKASFAGELYRICVQLYGIPDKFECYANPALKNQIVPGCGDRTVRDILIEVGNMMRTVNPNVWINAARQAYASTAHNRILVFTDARYPNELEAFPNALKVRIIAPDRVQDTQDVADNAMNDHESMWNLTLMNNGTEQDFQELAVAFCERFFK